MKEKLIKQLNHSYSPYSHFRVAALLQMKDGREFLGNNIENASYGATICAERVAIFTAIAVPCFACRQVFTEFFLQDMPITVMNPNGESKTFTVAELCPYPFNEDDLK